MRWTAKPKPEQNQVEELSQSLNVDEIVATLLVQRNITTFDEARDFFRPNLKKLHDPWLMKGMETAVNRLEKAIQNNEKILVYGDYDVDGTTSVALVYDYLNSFYPNVATYIPDRYQEGYGVSYQGIDYAADNDISLIIALDCGIKAIDKVDYANDKEIDFIICDHHRPGNQIPNAVAVLDPKQNDCNYPYKELCGCGVGFKFMQAYHQKKGGNFSDLLVYLDLVATAIGADIVPITGENRILAYHGLKQINTNPRPGFKAIIDLTKKESLSITDVVFLIGPRINAAGRMKHGLYAVGLLTAKTETDAVELAKSIEELNTDRKGTDRNITAEALQQIEDNNEQERFTSVVYQENWHKGVIGIVASRLTETYYRPTLVFTKSGNKLAASARSVKGFDVYNALEASSTYIEQFGGHKYAAGLTLEEKNYAAFKEKFETVVKTTIDPKLLEPEQVYDCELNFKQITPKLLRILNQFAPFGPGNLSPVFYTKNAKDTGFAKGVGKDEEHLKCMLYQEAPGKRFGGIGFGLAEKKKLLENHSPVEVLYNLDENEWNGNVSIQLKLKDIR
ncbi:MAG: single-stranded-DNA-specific exonuclease RecJ [Bacteroidota bacterium]